MGLRDLRVLASDKKGDKKDRTALPSFKQYRENDGKFYFKFVDAQGKLLLQSAGFASPKEAGQAIKRLQELTGPLSSVLREIPLQNLHLLNPTEIDSALQLLLAAKD